MPLVGAGCEGELFFSSLSLWANSFVHFVPRDVLLLTVVATLLGTGLEEVSRRSLLTLLPLFAQIPQFAHRVGDEPRFVGSRRRSQHRKRCSASQQPWSQSP